MATDSVIISGFSWGALQDLDVNTRAVERVARNVRDVEFAVAQSAQVVSASVREMEIELVARLADVTDLLANPGAVAADERCRAASLAIEQQWWDEAANEATAAIEIYPLRPVAHFLFGIAQLELAQTEKAVESLQSALRYATAGEYACGVTAALLVNTIYGWVGRTEDGRRALEFAHDRLPGCVDVIIALINAEPTPELVLELAVLDAHALPAHPPAASRAAFDAAVERCRSLSRFPVTAAGFLGLSPDLVDKYTRQAADVDEGVRILRRTGRNCVSLRSGIDPKILSRRDETRSLKERCASIRDTIARIESDAGPLPSEPRLKAGKRYRAYLDAYAEVAERRAPLHGLGAELRVAERRLQNLPDLIVLERQADLFEELERTMSNVRFHSRHVTPLAHFLATFGEAKHAP